MLAALRVEDGGEPLVLGQAGRAVQIEVAELQAALGILAIAGLLEQLGGADGVARDAAPLAGHEAEAGAGVTDAALAGAAEQPGGAPVVAGDPASLGGGQGQVVAAVQIGAVAGLGEQLRRAAGVDGSAVSRRRRRRRGCCKRARCRCRSSLASDRAPPCARWRAVNPPDPRRPRRIRQDPGTRVFSAWATPSGDGRTT